MLLALADGRALHASMLAAEAGIAASTTSEHLRRLTAGGLITVTTYGRFRYYRLAGPAVADLIEAVARVAPTRPVSRCARGRGPTPCAGRAAAMTTSVVGSGSR